MPSPAAGAATGTESIRTLALVGPAAAGKTLLAEALLQRCGVIGAMGSIERGSTVSDHDVLERRMQHSLNSALLHVEHAGTRIHIVDTPGGNDFLGQSLPALEAVETAAIVINAATGIEPMAVRMMEYAAARGLDRLIIVNRIDAAPEKLEALLAQIRAAFGNECLPLNLPDADATRVVDCFYNRAGHSDFGAVEDAHRALVEQVVEVDAAFVDRYLEDGDVDAAELHAPLEQALREGHLIPVCFVSAKTGAGVGELLDIIVRLLPNPTEGNPPAFLKGEG
ncbi:MAG: elongation factor G, partial [Rubrivivax sp.]|nr:elongation factor G [Rubrivivax sp.]